MLRRIDRLLLRVPNLPAAVKFWTDVYGLTLVRQEPAVATLRYPESDAEVLLHADPDLPAEAVFHLVADVRDLYKRRAELRLKFNAPPARVARGYKATVRDPFGTVLLLLDRTLDSPDAPGDGGATEDGRVPSALFPGVEQRHAVRPDALAKVYGTLGRTADDLPYTVHFERLYAAYADAFADPKPEKPEVWRHLLTLRKKGQLPKLGAARSRAPDVPPEALKRLRELVGTSIGRRDRLPYTPRFDEIAEAFNRELPRRLAPHQIWRLIAGLAK